MRGCLPLAYSPAAASALLSPAVQVKLRDRAYKARGHDKPDEAQQQINERVEELAKKKGLSMAQVALAWSLSNEDFG